MQTDRVRAHGLEVGAEGEDSEGVEEHAVDQAVEHAPRWHEHDEEHHELGEEHEHPGDDAAHDATAVADEPHGARGAQLGRRGTVLWAQVAGVPLDVPAAVRRALHPTSLATLACYRGGTKIIIQYRFKHYILYCALSFAFAYC